MLRLSSILFLCGLLLAQQAPQPVRQDQSQATQEPPPFTATVENVVAPVLVYNRDGEYVNGLRADQFRLFDSGKEQSLRVDVSFVPISLVIVIQSSARVEKILPQVNRIGNLITPQVIGEGGEAAVIAYDARIRTLLEFTSDTEKIAEAVKKIQPGSTSSRMIDAVEQGSRMLRSRPVARRRIMLLIGETRDMASEANARETLLSLQLNNVMLFAVDMSRFLSTLSAPTPMGRPDPLPPAMRPLPSNVPATPTTVQQTYGTNGGSAQFIPLMVEIFKDVKAVFKANPVELFTKGTGGSEFGFYRQRGLEDAISKIGEQLHSQYLISYSPNNKDEGGFHEIKVFVSGHPDYKTQTRPGYWVATHQ